MIRRRWGLRAVGLVATGTTLVAASACGSSVATSTGADVRAVAADYYVSEYGVRVAIKVGYDQAREVVGAQLRTADGSVAASMYPLDGMDPDTSPASVTMAPGDQLILEGTLLPTCEAPLDAPLFEVFSQRQGTQQTDRFGPADVDGYHRSVAEWCARPVTMNVTGSTVTPQGRYEVRVELSNPGPDPVTVTSARVTDGSSTWEEATVVVPGGSLQGLSIDGQGPPECAATPPWELGRVTADGRVIEPATADGWC